MPRNKDIKKVLVIGSGPIIIGQAAEFDYAGTQACRSLKEEGMEVLKTISLMTSLAEPMLVPVNTWPSSNIRNAFIQSPFLCSLILS